MEMGASYFSFSTHASVPLVEQMTSTYNIKPNYITTTSCGQRPHLLHNSIVNSAFILYHMVSTIKDKILTYLNGGECLENNLNSYLSIVNGHIYSFCQKLINLYAVCKPIMKQFICL